MQLKIEISPHDKFLMLGLLFIALAFSIFLLYGNRLNLEQMTGRIVPIQFEAPSMSIPGNQFMMSSNPLYNQLNNTIPMQVNTGLIKTIIQNNTVVVKFVNPVKANLTNNIAILPAPRAVVAPLYQIDKFNVKEIYKGVPGGEQWFMGNNPNNDPRTGGGETNGISFTSNQDGSFNVQSNEVRYGIQTSTGYHPDQIKTLDQTQRQNQGYTEAPNDWKNVEITAYLKPLHMTSSTQNGASHIELGAHGTVNSNGRQVGGFDISCGATAYHSNTYPDGRVKFEKDLMHNQGYTVEYSDPSKLNQLNVNAFDGQNFIGVKFIVYQLPNGAQKLEQWVDDSTANGGTPGNNWREVLQYIDSGGWGPTKGSIGTLCGGGEYSMANWGGPIALIRWDNIDSMDLKWASVREIIPPLNQ